MSEEKLITIKILIITEEQELRFAQRAILKKVQEKSTLNEFQDYEDYYDADYNDCHGDYYDAD